MALLSIALTSTLVIIAAPPLQGTNCHTEEGGRWHRLGFVLPDDMMMSGDLHNELVLAGNVTGFVGEMVQHVAPTVTVLDGRVQRVDPTPQALSTDVPENWTPVRYGPLIIEVRVLGTVETFQAMEHVVLLLDNRPVESPHDLLSPELSPVFETGLFQASYRYTLSCPLPGKHILQARYKVGGLWSRLSAPLHFDVRLPDPPQIIGISGGTGNPVPIRNGRTISVTEPSLRLQLAQVASDSTIIAYLNGKPIKTGKSDGSCCRSETNQSQDSATSSNTPDACCCRIVKLKGHIPPGVHRLTVRTVDEPSNGSISSEFSNEVVFRYYDEDVYLLRPGRHCGNLCWPSRYSPACVAPKPSLSSHSSPESPQPQPDLPATLKELPSPQPESQLPEREPLEGAMPSTLDAIRFVPHYLEADSVIQPSMPDPPVAQRNDMAIEPRMSFIALQQGRYLEAAQKMVENTREFRDSAATAADAAARPAAEAMEHLRLATLELAKVTEQQGQEQQRPADKSREAVQARATDAVRAREAAMAARTAADLALGQARIRAKEIEQHVITGNTAATEAARLHLEAAHAAAGAAANEALKQRDLAAQHARSAATHLSDLTGLVRQEKERTQDARLIELKGTIGKLVKSVPKMIRRTIDSISKFGDDKIAAIRFAENMEELAEREEAKADAWIRVVQAESRIERAAAITGPPSPFYFAAPAHFPIRGFGAGGEVIERPGAVIYEDMVFSFDRDGNYHLRLSILTPDLPTILHLQLQLQPYPNGPWYTITLPPQQFRPEESRNGRPQPRVIQDHVIQGRSEILHRCYGEMGKDATIRRTGSARFGYGFDAMRDAAAR